MECAVEDARKARWVNQDHSGGKLTPVPPENPVGTENSVRVDSTELRVRVVLLSPVVWDFGAVAVEHPCTRTRWPIALAESGPHGVFFSLPRSRPIW